MKINTLSIVIGNRACNARCGFCVSRMTGFGEVAGKALERHLPMADTATHSNFEAAIQLAKIAGTTTVLLTGKGEPTLSPHEITRYLRLLAGQFPFIELQTNGLAIGRAFRNDAPESVAMREKLAEWRALHLNTIALSVVSERNEENADVYHHDYPDLAATVDRLHEMGFTVRLSLMLVGGIVDTPERLAAVVAWCRARGVEQLTVRPIRRPDATHDEEVSEFVLQRGLPPSAEDAITGWVERNGTKILRLSHGASVFDVFGQNVCLTDCLTVPEAPDHIRTLIFYSSGRVAYHWHHPGAVLLGGSRPD